MKELSAWSMRRRVLALLLLGMLAPGGPALAQGLALQPRQPGVSAGAVIEFDGAGFIAGERIATWATTPDQVALGGEYGRAHADGTVRLAFRVPDDAIGGRWFFTARGDRSQAPVVAGFEVSGRSPASAELQGVAAPPAGPPGASFAFAATGFRKNERVSYWLTSPDGRVYAAYDRGGKADHTGRVDLVWQAPPEAPAGPWVITLQGFTSGVARAIRFKISSNGL